MANVTVELVEKAYEVLATGERSKLAEVWAEDMNWLVPGHNTLSGWWHGLDGFISFFQEYMRLSAGSFNMTRTTGIMISDEHSADVTRNVGYRVGHEPKGLMPGDGEVPYTKLDIDVVHVLRWRDGKVIEGKGAIFGDGTTEYDQFWSPVGKEGERIAVS